ncbi:MAG TPA: hypothetical protein VGL75_02530, partial [Acidothermaceae bacterium]
MAVGLGVTLGVAVGPVMVIGDGEVEPGGCELGGSDEAGGSDDAGGGVNGGTPLLSSILINVPGYS